MRQGLRELRKQRLDVDVLLNILQESNLGEWLHAFGPNYDQLRDVLAPTPPVTLRSITARQDEEGFRWTGARDIGRLMDLYVQFATTPPRPLSILDFGCGCGRLTRYLNMSPHKTFASDANPEHVAWCAANLENVTTRLNQRIQPLPFDDRSIDFAYAWSVFTHLRRDEAEAWLFDLARVLRPGGLLIATIHSELALRTLMSSEPHQTMMQVDAERAQLLAKQLHRDGYVFIPYNEGVTQLANVGPDYGNCFMDPQQSRSLWEGAFEMMAEIPGGAVAGWQDALVLRKREDFERMAQRLCNSN
jgi:SAM-dependent methyltransferase